jgi:preprotein translocase subunit SecG
MTKINHILLLLLVSTTSVMAQVVAVIAAIFIGIIIFLYRLDTKLTKLENHIKNEQ